MSHRRLQQPSAGQLAEFLWPAERFLTGQLPEVLWPVERFQTEKSASDSSRWRPCQVQACNPQDACSARCQRSLTVQVPARDHQPQISCCHPNPLHQAALQAHICRQCRSHRSRLHCRHCRSHQSHQCSTHCCCLESLHHPLAQEQQLQTQQQVHPPTFCQHSPSHRCRAEQVPQSSVACSHDVLVLHMAGRSHSQHVGSVTQSQCQCHLALQSSANQLPRPKPQVLVHSHRYRQQ